MLLVLAGLIWVNRCWRQFSFLQTNLKSINQQHTDGFTSFTSLFTTWKEKYVFCCLSLCKNTYYSYESVTMVTCNTIIWIICFKFSDFPVLIQNCKYTPHIHVCHNIPPFKNVMLHLIWGDEKSKNDPRRQPRRACSTASVQQVAVFPQ